MTRAAPDSTADNIALQARLSLLLVAPLSGLAQAGLSPILPKISEHFAGEPHADVLVRLLVSSVAFAMIFGSAAGGFLADRLGQRKMLLWSLLGYAIAGAAGFVLDDLRAILVSRLSLGVFNAAAGVITAAIITTRIASSDRNKWLGFFTVAGTFGAICVLFFVGLVGAHHWRFVFLFHLSAIPVLLLLAALLPRDQDTPVVARAVASSSFPFGLMLFGVATGAVAATVTVFLPYHLASIGEAAPQRVATALIANAIMASIISFAYGWIRKYLGAVKVFVIGFITAAVGTLLIVMASTYGGAFAGIAVVGISVGLIGPNLFAAAAAAVPPERRARTIGLVRASFYSAPLLAQLALEPLSQNYGPAGALAALAAFALLMAGATLLGRRSLAPAF
jgi:MFS family permease